MKFADMKIGNKLFGGFICVVAIFLIITGYQIIQMQVLSRLQDDGAERAKASIAIGQVSHEAAEVYAIMADAVINRNLAESKKAFARAKTMAIKDMTTVNTLADTEQERAWAKEFESAYGEYLQVFETGTLPILEKMEKETTAAGEDERRIRENDARIDELREATMQPLGKMIESLKKESLESDELYDSIARRVQTVSMVLTIIGLLSALGFAWIITRAITTPIAAAVATARQLSLGDISMDIQVPGKDEAGQLLAAMKTMVENLRATVQVAEKLGQGDLAATVKILSEKDTLGQALTAMVDNIRKLAEEINSISRNVREGRLDARGDGTRYSGGWRHLVEGLNELVEAFVRPINVTAEYIERIAKGDIPEQISEAYKGDFNEIKNNLNFLIKVTNEMTAIAQKISMGDLRVTVERRSQNDELMIALEKMVKDLTEIAVNVQTAADQVASGSQQISSSGQQMSQGATEQSASVEQVSSSMEEMNSTIQQNADNARETAGIATKAAADAQEGGRAVAETVKAMKNISEKINIIEEIARQTNMLALNAAIEAARAGEHGKGFAVVAAEVRKLAERSQTAAKEISAQSISSVEISEKAGMLLDSMVPSIQKTAELVQEINAASAEQADGIRQVTTAVQQLDQIIQQNAAATEEMASTSEELSGQAEQLKDAAAFFKVEKGNGQSYFLQQKQTHRLTDIKTSRISKSKPDVKKNLNPAAFQGVALEMKESDDSEFEKY